jgi:site-specific DNA recombinase
MQRAVLCARVSTDAQQKEGTIESRLVELKRQIAAAAYVLVKEYVDDGITGTLLDRPALEQLRQDMRLAGADLSPVMSRTDRRPFGAARPRTAATR